MKIAWHKHGVLVSKVLNLASGYEPMLEALFNVGEPAKEMKNTKPPTGTRIGISQYIEIHPTANNETTRLEILSKAIERETVRKGGWRSKEWTGKVLVVLVFGVRSDMTRIEFKKKCNEVGLYCLAIGKVEREGEHFRVTINQSASKEWERIETSKVSAWVRGVGWRICIANGTANLRRSPRVNGGKEKQEQVNAQKGKGRGHSGPKQTDKGQTGKGKENRPRENGSKNDEERTVDKRRVGNDSERKLRIGSWNVCGFATDERRSIDSPTSK